MGYVACLGQIPEETAHVLQNLVSANGLKSFGITFTRHSFAYTGAKAWNEQAIQSKTGFKQGAKQFLFTSITDTDQNSYSCTAFLAISDFLILDVL